MKTLSDFIINKPIDIRRCSFWSLSRQARLRLFTVSGEHLRSLRRRSERIFHSIELRAVMGSAELKLGNYWNETGWNLSPRYNESLWIAFNFTSNVAHKSETESGWWISRAINFHCDPLLMRSRTVEMWVNCISIWIITQLRSPLVLHSENLIMASTKPYQRQFSSINWNLMSIHKTDIKNFHPPPRLTSNN